MTAFSPLLLLWCGLAATLTAAVAAMSFSGRLAHAWAVRPARSRSQALTWTVAAGVFIYPALYGLVFELGARADVVLGFYVGSAHAVLAFLLARTAAPTLAAARAALWHLVYATAFAFLYVTP